MNKRVKKIVAMLLVLVFFVCNLSLQQTVSALKKQKISECGQDNTSDDPGKNRLNGEIPDEFYWSNPGKDIFSQKSVTMNSPYSGLTYTHADAFDGYQILNGIDVSQFQGKIDWAKVKASGIDFAFIRVGYRGYGAAGNFGEDSQYKVNIEGALAAGIRVGVYIFSQATTTAEAEEEAQYLLDRLGTYNVTLPLVMDYEFFSGTSGEMGRLYNAKLSKEAATAVCMAFCNKIAAAGYKPMVYANASMLSYNLNADTISAQYPIWLANYTTKTDYAGKYNMWQYNSKGQVNGISGNVDLDFWYTKNPDEFAPGAVSQPQPQEPSQDMTVVSNFKISAKTKTTASFSWDSSPDVTGYEIYRATAYDGKYKRIKNIPENTTVSYRQTGLTGGKEYYYRIRTYVTNESGTTYGPFSKILTVRTTKAYTRKVQLKSRLNLRKLAVSNAQNVISVPKNTLLTVTSHTLDSEGNLWYYVSYKKNGVNYKGYVSKEKVTLYRYGKVTSKNLNIRKGVGTTKRFVISIKKGKKVTVQTSKKDSKGNSWYRIQCKVGKYYYQGYVLAKYVKLY